MVQTDQHVNEVHDHHGNSVAAWATVTVMMIGALIASVAVVVPSLPMGIVGGVIVLVGAVLGKVLQTAGYGISGKPGH
ncbi:MAG TPA: HGxxPAAW family protein [Kineosporiaceae bacterium]|nr:HGxxPAAW family protein [Kineosporiaceae bacterium]